MDTDGHAASVGLGLGGAPHLRWNRTHEEPVALANRCHRRLGTGVCRRLLDHNPGNALFGANPAARSVGRLLQTILTQSHSVHRRTARRNSRRRDYSMATDPPDSMQPLPAAGRYGYGAIAFHWSM